MKLRAGIVYWLLLLVPTLVIGAVGIHLLRHEQQRLDRLERDSALDRSRALAETLQRSVESAERDVSAALRRIPEEQLLETLLRWERTNPLIRNVFVWKPGVGIQYPVAGVSATREERLFLVRYDALFVGRVPWWQDDSETQGTPKSSTPDSGETISRPQISRGHGKLKAGSESGSAGVKELGGWIPWYAENKLYIMGWVRRNADGLVYGVELELVALLSKLIDNFPSNVPEGMTYALVDDSGRVLHQSGNVEPEADRKPYVSVSLSPRLPHWQVAVFVSDDRSGLRSGASFFIVSGLLLGTFIAAIVTGGALLLIQSNRDRRDALQKSSFVSNVSHELRTPLTSIRMYAELLHEDRIKDPEQRQQYLRVIVSESQRLTRLLNNVLDFGRLEQGRMKFNRQRLDVAELARGIMEAHRLPIQEAGMVLKEEIPDAAVWVEGDRDALKQAVINIIDNAIKYAPEGGELAINLDVHNNLCRLRVMDRGPGVPLRHRERIFEKFQRVDDSLTARRPGSGLGLTIAREILRGLGGDLDYEPREGGGSCFTARLPIQPDGVSGSRRERSESP